MKTLMLSAVAACGLLLSGAQKADAGGSFYFGIGGGHNHYHGGYGGFGGWNGGYISPWYNTGHYYWHDTSHYDYHPGVLVPHGNHYHYIPGHYHYHNTGHWDYHH